MRAHHTRLWSLAAWLGAELIIDSWRPVRLDKGIYLDGEITFH